MKGRLEMSEQKYAVIQAQGLQFRVAPQEEHVMPKMKAAAGSEITFDKVLLVSDGTKVTLGRPTVEGATVRAQVVGDEKGEKIDVGVYKRRHKYRRKIGYRDSLTRVRILDIRA
jgi:large subunit ribosomal protein L21